MKSIFMLLLVFCLAGCEYGHTLEKLQRMIEGCEKNGGVKMAITYVNENLYSLECNDGAAFKYLTGG